MFSHIMEYNKPHGRTYKGSQGILIFIVPVVCLII